MLTLAEVQEIAELLSNSYAEVVINGSCKTPRVIARGHNRAWTTQRVLHTHLDGKRRVIMMNWQPLWTPLETKTRA